VHLIGSESNSSIIARPMPLVPPVTRAVVPGGRDQRCEEEEEEEREAEVGSAAAATIGRLDNNKQRFRSQIARRVDEDKARMLVGL